MSGKRYVTIGGQQVEIVSDAEAEQADAIICMAVTIPLMLPDNVTGRCSLCQVTVQFRPHVPKAPAKWCVECAFTLATTVRH